MPQASRDVSASGLRRRYGAPDREPPTTNRSLLKAFQILSCFTEEHPEWSVTALARHLNMPKSTLSGILATMRYEDILYQSPTTGHYRLGLRCLELGYHASVQLYIRDVAYPYLESLLQEAQQIVYLGIPYRHEVLYVEALYPVNRRINYSSVGRRAPMHCTAIGKAMLAFMPDDEIEAMLAERELHPYTENTITDPDVLRTELKEIRARGYSTDLEEREKGIRCVGAPFEATPTTSSPR